MSARLSLVVASLVVMLSGGNAGAADVTIRSVPYEQVKAEPVVVKKPAKVETVPAVTVSAACPCGHSLACVGPKGGRYCVNSRGQKKYQ